jgi:hypothetical protein
MSVLVSLSKDGQASDQEETAPDCASSKFFCVASVAFRAPRMTQAAPSLYRSLTAFSMSYKASSDNTMAWKASKTHLVTDVYIKSGEIYTEKYSILRSHTMRIKPRVKKESTHIYNLPIISVRFVLLLLKLGVKLFGEGAYSLWMNDHPSAPSIYVSW